MTQFIQENMYALLVWLFKKMLELFDCYDNPQPVIVQIDCDGDGEPDVEVKVHKK